MPLILAIEEEIGVFMQGEVNLVYMAFLPNKTKHFIYIIGGRNILKS